MGSIERFIDKCMDLLGFGFAAIAFCAMGVSCGAEFIATTHALGTGSGGLLTPVLIYFVSGFFAIYWPLVMARKCKEMSLLFKVIITLIIWAIAACIMFVYFMIIIAAPI